MTITRDQDYWETYLSERTGEYQYRCIRYEAVLDRLMLMGFGGADSLVDVGAGRQEFEQFMREQGWRGHYRAVDGSIDGTDLDEWVPPWNARWMVAIEVIEHLHDPHRLVREMRQHSLRGMVITTPNPETTDVLGMDRTHVTEIHPHMLTEMGLTWERSTLFPSHKRGPDDSLIGWRQR